MQHQPGAVATEMFVSRPFLTERLRKALRVGLAVAVILVLIGTGSTLYLVTGLALAGLVLWVRGKEQFSQLHDRQSAKRLSSQLGPGCALPSHSPPVNLERAGYGVEPREICFIDGARGEALVWYGNLTASRHRMILAWGSPMAWMMSILATFTMWHFGRRQAKKNAPTWRDAEPVRIWFTDQRFIVHRTAGQVPWMQIRFENIVNWWLERDGVAMQLDFSPAPIKLRCGSPAWVFVLANYLRGGIAVSPRPI